MKTYVRLFLYLCAVNSHQHYPGSLKSRSPWPVTDEEIRKKRSCIQLTSTLPCWTSSDLKVREVLGSASITLRRLYISIMVYTHSSPWNVPLTSVQARQGRPNSGISPRNGEHRLEYSAHYLGKFSPGFAGVHSQIHELSLDDQLEPRLIRREWSGQEGCRHDS